MEFDPADNRRTQTNSVTGEFTTYVYNNNALLSTQNLAGRTTFTYDANGNQLTIEEPSGDRTTNTWDGENRLVQVDHPGGDVIAYNYSADGLKVVKDDGVSETHFVYDGNNLLQETDDVGTLEAEYTCIPLTYAHATPTCHALDNVTVQHNHCSQAHQAGSV